MENLRLELEESRLKEQFVTEAMQKFQDEVDNSAEFILQLEEKVFKANKTTLELLKQLKEDENEILNMKDQIKELRQKVAVYCAVKTDLIDRKLADFINNWHDKHKLKLLFLRESEGIYLFGTKRLAIRVENDKINVRVGGGYLSIEEFLEQYTQIELQKLGRKENDKKNKEKEKEKENYKSSKSAQKHPWSGRNSAHKIETLMRKSGSLNPLSTNTDQLLSRNPSCVFINSRPCHSSSVQQLTF